MSYAETLARLKKSANAAEVEPTKPTQPGFVGFKGATPAPIGKINMVLSDLSNDRHSPVEENNENTPNDADSQVSQGIDAAGIRAQLLGLAELVEVGEQLIRKLTAAELAGCANQIDAAQLVVTQSLRQPRRLARDSVDGAASC